MTLRRWIVSILESACPLVHNLVGCKLAYWSYSLDRRWDTGVWRGGDAA